MSVESLKAKQAVIDEIKSKLERAQAAVVIDYMGINVEEANVMRKQLREVGVDYSIYKNTLMSRAVEGTDYQELSNVLSGPSAFAFSYEDATAPARELNKLIKQFDKMAFKAGIIEGKFYDKDGVIEIAKLPSRDELIAKFMGSIKSPVSKLAYLLQAIADQKASGAEPVPAVETVTEESAPVAEEAASAEEAVETEEAPVAEETASAEAETPAE